LSLPVSTGEAQGAAHVATQSPVEALLFRRYPVAFHLFDDGLFVVGASADHLDLIGSEVVRIGALPAADALKAVQRVSNADNDVGHRLSGPRLLSIAEVCHQVGVTEDPEQLRLALRSPAGEARDAVLQPLPASGVPSLVMAHERTGSPRPLWLSHTKARHWFEYLPEHNAVYVQVNAIEDTPERTLARFAADVMAAVEARSADRLVLDLRLNGGGNNYLNRALVRAVMESPRVNRFGGLFTLIGRETFSAAMNLVSQLELWTNTLFAGEPTGTTPSHYGDARRHRLPNSGLTLRLSSVYWRDWSVDEGRRWVAPHIDAGLTSRDYFGGRDPVLDAVLAFRAPDRLSDQLLWALDHGGPEAAWHRLYLYRSEPATATADTFEDVRTIGRTLLDRGRAAEAVGAFRYNLRDRPSSAAALGDLGEALVAAGKPAEARPHLEKALGISPGDARLQRLLRAAAP
jgi:tetratricopeptide (TPR) repeat protein